MKLFFTQHTSLCLPRNVRSCSRPLSERSYTSFKAGRLGRRHNCRGIRFLVLII